MLDSILYPTLNLICIVCHSIRHNVISTHCLESKLKEFNQILCVQ